MIWAQRLKRVFGIDIETCPACGGAVRIIACIEDPDIIEKILTHLDAKGAEPQGGRRAGRLAWWSANGEKRVRERVAGMDSRANMPA